MGNHSITASFFGQRPAAKALLSVEPRWWDADELCADSRFAKTHDCGSHFDWDVDLTVNEFCDLHEKFRRRAVSSIYAGPERRAIIRRHMEDIDGAIAGTLGTIAKIHVNIAVWQGAAPPLLGTLRTSHRT